MAIKTVVKSAKNAKKVVVVTRHKLSETEKEKMRKEYSKGAKLSEIVERYGCSNGQAWIVCSDAGQAWRNAGGKSEKKIALEMQEAKGARAKIRAKKISDNIKMSALSKIKTRTKGKLPAKKR